VLLAQPEVIVVRAHHHVLIRLSRQVPGHVSGVALLARRVDRHVRDNRRVERERVRVQFAIDRRNQTGQVFVGRLEQPLRRLAGDLLRRNSDVLLPDSAGNLLQPVVLAGMVRRVVHQQHGARSVLFGVDQLVRRSGVRGEPLAIEDALVIGLLRFVPQHQDDLALHIHAGVVVVLEFRGRNAVAGKDHSSLCGSVAADRKGDGVAALGERHARRSVPPSGPAAPSETGPDSDFVLLEIPPAEWCQARRAKVSGHIFGRAVEFRRPGAPSLQFRG
jgi:hypothetical protein